jgi:N-acetylglucosaminyldiphosphoundecaprenol N-acetyl-beta-D-mannosaminyltransferase
MSTPERIELFGVPFDVLDMQGALDRITGFVEADDGRLYQGVGVNLEHLQKIVEEPYFAEIVRPVDIILPDGWPPVALSRAFGEQPLPERVATPDLATNLLALSAEKGWGVYLLGAKEESLVGAVQAVRAAHPGVRVVGSRNGYFGEEDEAEIVADINASGAEILLIAITSPKKEEFVERHRAELKLRFVLGVGGYFDVLSGVASRAPLWLQKIGLEWSWRIVQEPRRMGPRYLHNLAFGRNVAEEAFRRALRRVQPRSEQLDREAGGDLHVAMVGPSLETIGGIASMVQTVLRSPELDGVDVRYFSSSTAGSHPRKLARALTGPAEFAAALARGYRPHLLHVHLGGPVSLYREALYARAAQAHGVPTLIHIHATHGLEQTVARSRLAAGTMRRLLRGASMVLVVNRPAVALAQSWAGPEVPVRVLYNPVDPDDLTVPARHDPEPPVRILYMGWIIRAKGVWDLLDAVPIVRAQAPDVQFVFAGHGADFDEFQAEVGKRAFGSEVQVLGWVQGEQRRAAYADADIFCLPSHSEGFPVTVVEAMTAGLPVTASRISGIPDAVIHDETGLLFEAKDVGGIADALVRLALDRDLRVAMGAAGRERATSNFERGVVASALLDAWKVGAGRG